MLAPGSLCFTCLKVAKAICDNVLSPDISNGTTLRKMKFWLSDEIQDDRILANTANLSIFSPWHIFGGK